MSRRFARTAVVAMLVMGVSGPAHSQTNREKEILETLDFQQKLEAQVPMDLQFENHDGKTVSLKSIADGKPVVLSLAYYNCPMLCTLVLNGLVKALNVVGLGMGEDFNVVTLSINPKEKHALAHEKRATYGKHFAGKGSLAGWHFLTGEQAAIDQVADAVGFKYVYTPENDQYAHASGLVVLTPGGVVSRYLFGVEYSARDLGFGLIEASKNRIGSAIDKLLLYCYQYDPRTGGYGLVIMRVLRLAGIATVGILAFAVLVMLRQEKKRARATAVPSTNPVKPGEEV